MKNEIIITIIILVLTLTPVIAYGCKDETEYWNVPCDASTPYISGWTGDCNVTITNLNDTSVNMTINTTKVGDGTYNFTFNYTGLNSYSIVACDNSTASISVVWGTEESETHFNLWLVLFSIFFFLLIFGFLWQEYIFLFFSGCLAILMGVYIFQNGISVYTVSYWWVYPFVWIIVGLGIVLSVAGSYEFLENYSGGKF
jgi:hypothetical protein